MRKARLFGSLIGILFLLVTVATALLFLRPNTYLGVIKRLAGSASGYELDLASLEVDSNPLTIAMTDLTLRNPQEPGSEPLLRVARVQTNVKLLGFLFGGDDWWSAVIQGVDVDYSIDSQGQSNWDLITAEGSSIAADSSENVAGDFSFDGPIFEFNAIEISNFAVRQSAGEDSQLLQLNNVTLAKNSDNAVNLSLHGRYQDQPLSITGLIPIADSTGVRELDINASLFGSKWEIAGTLAADESTPTLVQYSIDADDLSSLTSLLGTDFSNYTPLSIAGNIRKTPAAQYDVQLNGMVASNSIGLQVSGSIEDSGYVLDQFEIETRPVSLVGNGSFDLAGNALTANINASQLNVDGVLDILAVDEDESQDNETPIKIALDQTIAELLTELIKSVDDLLEERMIDVDLQVDSLVWEGNDYQQVDLRAITEGDTIKLSVEIDNLVDAPARPSENVAEVLLELKDDAEAEENSDLTSFFPLIIGSTLTFKESGLTLDPIEFIFESDLVTGNIDIDYSENPPMIIAKFLSDSLNVDRFSTTSAEDIQGSGESLDEQSGDVISDAVIDWSWLSSFELDASVELAMLHFNESDFRDFMVTIRVENGELVVDPLTAGLSKGGLEGSLTLSKTEQGVDFKTHIVATELTPADLGQPDEGLIDGGETDLFIELGSSGASAQELAQNLNGELAVEVQRATIRNNLIEIIGSDVLSQFLNLINPFARNDGQTELECAAMFFNVNEGVITSSDKLAIETSKMVIRGGGTIDLSDETLRIDFVPSARSGLGISLGNLASVVRLGGTLGNPTPVADPEGIIRSGATIGAAIATGGLSLLAQGLFDRARNTSTSCGRIFERNVEIPDSLEVDDA